MKNVLLVDDHSIVRQGLKNLIALEADLTVTGEAGSGLEAINLVRNNTYDIVVLDISMPDKNGVDTLHDLKHVSPDLPVLILSGYAEAQYALNLIRNGCKGYLSKDALSDREFQVFFKLAGGLSATEIGTELNISVKTVSTYRSRILEKMSLKTNADLTYYAIKNGLIT